MVITRLYLPSVNKAAWRWDLSIEGLDAPVQWWCQHKMDVIRNCVKWLIKVVVFWTKPELDDMLVPSRTLFLTTGLLQRRWGSHCFPARALTTHTVCVMLAQWWWITGSLLNNRWKTDYQSQVCIFQRACPTCLNRLSHVPELLQPSLIPSLLLGCCHTSLRFCVFPFREQLNYISWIRIRWQIMHIFNHRVCHIVFVSFSETDLKTSLQWENDWQVKTAVCDLVWCLKLNLKLHRTKRDCFLSLAVIIKLITHLSRVSSLGQTQTSLVHTLDSSTFHFHVL